jgi:hypothetical protein
LSVLDRRILFNYASDVRANKGLIIFAIVATARAGAATFEQSQSPTNTVTTNAPAAYTPQINVPQVSTPTVTVPQAAPVPVPQAVMPPSAGPFTTTFEGVPRTTPTTPRVVVPSQATAATPNSLISQQLPKVRPPAPAPPPPLGNTASLAQEQPTIITNADGTILMPLAEGLTNAPHFSPRLWDKTNAPAATPPYHYHW